MTLVGVVIRLMHDVTKLANTIEQWCGRCLSSRSSVGHKIGTMHHLDSLGSTGLEATGGNGLVERLRTVLYSSTDAL